MDGLTFAGLNADALLWIGLLAPPIALYGTRWLARSVMSGIRSFL